MCAALLTCLFSLTARAGDQLNVYDDDPPAPVAEKRDAPPDVPADLLARRTTPRAELKWGPGLRDHFPDLERVAGDVEDATGGGCKAVAQLSRLRRAYLAAPADTMVYARVSDADSGLTRDEALAFFGDESAFRSIGDVVIAVRATGVPVQVDRTLLTRRRPAHPQLPRAMTQVVSARVDWSDLTCCITDDDAALRE